MEKGMEVNRKSSQIQRDKRVCVVDSHVWLLPASLTTDPLQEDYGYSMLRDLQASRVADDSITHTHNTHCIISSRRWLKCDIQLI